MCIHICMLHKVHCLTFTFFKIMAAPGVLSLFASQRKNPVLVISAFLFVYSRAIRIYSVILHQYTTSYLNNSVFTK